MAGAALFPALLVLSWPIFLSFPTDQISLFFSRWHTAVQKQLKQEMRASWWLFDSSWVASTDRTTHGSLSNYFQPYLRCLDPTGPRVKIDLFSSSETLNCWLFDSSCLRYLSCFFFMWNSCDTFRLDSKHRMQPETTQNRKWESCLSEWLEPTGPPRTLLCEAARMCEKAWACCESHELQRCEIQSEDEEQRPT